MDLGLDQSFGRLVHSKLSVFHSRVTDLITRKTKYDPFENLSSARLQGIEVDVGVIPMNYLYLNMSYHYLDAKDLDTDEQLEYRPQHTFSVSAEVTAFQELTLRLYLDYVSKCYYYSKDQLQYLDEYYLFDVNLSKRIFSLWEIWTACNNMFDVYYEDEAGFPLPGREFSIGLRVKL